MRTKYLAPFVFIAVLMSIVSCEKDDDPSTDNSGTVDTGKQINLVIRPKVGQDPIQLNTTYNINGQDVTFEFLKFYMSGIELMDEDGQVIADNDSEVILADTEQNAIRIGSTTVEQLGNLRFDIGLDQETNHMSADEWMDLSIDHPLAPPSMHWNWNSAGGFKFFRIDYLLDGAAYQSHAATDGLYQEGIIVDVSTVETSGETITIVLEINLASVFAGTPFPTNSNHGAESFNSAYMNALGQGIGIRLE